jgi:PAS domain S-box-containing protein
MHGGDSGKPKRGGRTGHQDAGTATEVLSEPLRFLADVSDDVFWVMDAETRTIVYVSSAYERVWRRSIPSLVGDPCEWHGFIEPEHQESARAAINALVRDGTPMNLSYRINDGEGHERWAHDRGWPIRARETGAVTAIIGIVSDITAEKVALDHQNLLLREMNHRVKNTLATVISMAHQTAATAPSLESFLEGFYARVHAFSGAHDLLMQNAWTSVSLEEVVTRTLAPYMQGEVERVKIRGPTVLLPHDPSVALNLVFHELATNAAKYGALSKPSGQVAVTWSVETSGSAGVLDLRWEEAGGPPVAPGARAGFGSRLIRRTLAVLGGKAEINLAPSGLDCWIALPLTSPEQS